MNNNKIIIHEVDGIKADDMSNIKSLEDWHKSTDRIIQLFKNKNIKKNGNKKLSNNPDKTQHLVRNDVKIK